MKELNYKWIRTIITVDNSIDIDTRSTTQSFCDDDKEVNIHTFILEHIIKIVKEKIPNFITVYISFLSSEGETIIKVIPAKEVNELVLTLVKNYKF